MSNNYIQETKPLFRLLRNEAFRFIIVRYNHYSFVEQIQQDISEKFPTRNIARLNAETIDYNSLMSSFSELEAGFLFIENFESILKEERNSLGKETVEMKKLNQRKQGITGGLNLRRDKLTKSPIALFLFIAASSDKLLARILMEKMPDLWSFRSLVLDLKQERFLTIDFDPKFHVPTFGGGSSNIEQSSLGGDTKFEKEKELKRLFKLLQDTPLEEQAFRNTIFPQIVDLQMDLGRYVATRVTLEEWAKIAEKKDQAKISQKEKIINRVIHGMVNNDLKEKSVNKDNQNVSISSVQLNEQEAFALFEKYYQNGQEVEKENITILLQVVNYDAFLIQFLAKSLQSENIALSQFFKKIKDKRKGLKVIIVELYQQNLISEVGRELLSMFAVLPNEYISYDILEDLIGEERLELQLKALVEKGWLSHDKELKAYRTHRVLQEIIQEENKDLLEDCRTLINNLENKLDFEVNTGHLINTGYDTALTYVQFVETLLGNIDGVDRDIANLNLMIGQYYETIGHLDKALSYYQKGLILNKELYESFPENISFKNWLAISYSKLGSTQTSLGNLEKALEYFEKDMKLTKGLYESSPENGSFKNSLAISYSQLGSTQTLLGNWGKALEYFENETTLFKELYESYPKNISYKFGLQISYEKLGDIHTTIGDIEAALNFYEEENKLIKELYEAYSQNVSFKYGLAVSYEKLGSTQTLLGNMEKAMEYYENETVLFEELFESSPQNVSFKNGLAISYAKLAQHHQKLEDKIEARSYFQKAEELWAELTIAAPQYVQFQKYLGIVRNELENL